MSKIKLENISKKYVNAGEEIEALKNINVEFDEGKFYAIIGHSGSGKTTLLQIIGTIDNATSGNYFINDKDVNKLNEKEKAKLRMEEIGFVFQNYYLNKNLKVIDNVMLPMYINNKICPSNRKIKAKELLRTVKITERYNHYPSELSGGESQRVAIARALVNEPNIILADEPTGNLDKQNEKAIFELLKELSKKEKCVIVVSHSNVVKEYADEIINIDHGEIVSKN